MSKKYNTEFIKNYINEHKQEIVSVICGMREDLGWTESTVYENGEFDSSFDWDSEYLCVAGIDGSIWATPVMEVEFTDGRTEIVECYSDYEEDVSASRIAEAKAFTVATGGMDYRV